MVRNTKKRLFTLTGVLILIISIVSLAYYGGEYSQPVKKVRIGYQIGLCHIAHSVAMEKGWWEKELGVPVEERIFVGGAPEMFAMMKGEVDVAYVGVGPAIDAIASGLDAKIVMRVSGMFSADLVVKPNFNYTNPESLIGSTIATLPAGSIQHTVLINHLLKNNIEINKINIKSAGVEMFGLLKQGIVDGIIMGCEFDDWAELEGWGKVVVRSNEMWPNHPCCVLVISGKLIRENPELAKKIVKVHFNATNYMLNHPKEAAELYVNHVWLNVKEVVKDRELYREAVLRELLLHPNGPLELIFNPNPREIINETMSMVQVHLKIGAINKKLTVDDLFDFRFYDDIVKS